MKKRSIKSVVGNCLLLEIQPDDHEKSIRSDTLVIPDSIKHNEDEKVMYSMDFGTVVDIGEMAFIKLHYESLPYEVGDTIMIVPNTGYLFHDSIKDKWYRIIKDVDVIAVLDIEV